jgi:transposase-like protein
MMTVMTGDNTEVRRAKRSWPARYKLDILNEIDEAKATGESGVVGEICRREGLYSSLISEWRNQRDRGALQGLTDKPKGRKPKDPTRTELARLRAENDKLRDELDTANELIEAQGKVSALLADLSRKSAEPNTTRP